MRRLLLVFGMLAGTAAAQDVLVIAPDGLRPALAEWTAYRTAQGHEVRVAAPADDLRAQVRAVRAASDGALRFVVLLGDARAIPAARYPTEVVREYERDWRVPSDHFLADLDDDGAPELAVGRLPADDLAEARAMLARSIAYESNDDFGPWRRRLNTIAGVGGFGFVQDLVLETVATRTLADAVPAAFEVHATYANPASPYCPPPARLGETVLERLNEGSLFVVYLGHGSRMRLDRMRVDGVPHDIFTDAQVGALDARHGAPIAFLVACSTGHFDGAPDCLGEMMLKEPGGPAAVLASSRVSMPYGNAVLAIELLRAALVDRVPTLGGALALAKRRALAPGDGERARAGVEGLANFYEPSPARRRQERLEHNHLYHLLGDPLLRMAVPQGFDVAVEETGDGLAASFESPVAGEAHIELVGPRTPNRPPRQGDDTEAFAEAYARANARVLHATTASVEAGRPVRIELPRPPGAAYLRIHVTATDSSAIAGLPLP